MARGSLQGSAEYKARIRAIKQTFKPYGRKWGTSAVKHIRSDAPVRTGKGKRSIRVKSATQRGVRVVASYYMAILDKGTKPYTIVPRKSSRLVFQAGGQTVFARKVDKPAARGLGYSRRGAREATRDVPMVETLIDQWNSAA